VYEKVVEYIIK